MRKSVAGYKLYITYHSIINLEFGTGNQYLQLAESAGFEPAWHFRTNILSRHASSTTRATLCIMDQYKFLRSNILSKNRFRRNPGMILCSKLKLDSERSSHQHFGKPFQSVMPEIYRKRIQALARSFSIMFNFFPG